ncbi:MAG: hypothetical protein K0A90_04330 [Methanosarcinaceae archaeon]|nr:hypothetical protein [Methanosarcinaceae archaeon]
MRTIMKNNDKLKFKLRNHEKAGNISHIVISGHTADKLDSEELDLYRFMIGGLQAK